MPEFDHPDHPFDHPHPYNPLPYELEVDAQLEKSSQIAALQAQVTTLLAVQPPTPAVTAQITALQAQIAALETI